MAVEREVAEYVIETAQAKAALDELIAKDAELRAQQGKPAISWSESWGGGGLDWLNLEPKKPVDELTKSVQELIKNKQKLAMTATLLGGEFGGLIGKMGGVVQMLLAAGPATITFAAALAGLAALTAGYRALRDHMQEAIDKKREFDNLHMSKIEKDLQAEVKYEEALGKRGVLTEEGKKEALRLRQAVGAEYGREVAPEVLAAAVAEGITKPEEVAVLDLLVERGAKIDETTRKTKAGKIEQVDPAYELLQKTLQAGGWDEAMGALAQGRATQQGAITAELWKRGGPTTVLPISPIEEEYVIQKQRGALRKGEEEYADFETNELRRRREAAAKAREAGRRRERASAQAPTPLSPEEIEPFLGEFGGFDPLGVMRIEPEYAEPYTSPATPTQMELSPSPPRRVNPAVIQRIVVNHNETFNNSGVTYNRERPETKHFTFRLGNSVHDPKVE